MTLCYDIYQRTIEVTRKRLILMKDTTKKKNLSRFALILVVMLTVAMLGSACSSKSNDGSGSKSNSDGEKPVAVITVKDFGVIKVELDPSEAPITVDHFVKLAKDGFYDGLTFHRIIEGFMIQGGDPNGDGSGGSGEKIKGEFKSNDVDNSITFEQGTIGMGRRSGDNDSADSQFFITSVATPHLDGDYAAFGHTIEGIDVVEAISKVETGPGDMPVTPVVIESIKIE